MTRRNEKCPCGSGKKYKNCCMQADLEREKFQPKTDRPYEENPNVKTPTWVIFIAAAALLAILCGVLWLFDLGRLAGTVFGVGMLILIFYAAFRNVPTLRDKAGDGGNIDFGNR